MTRGEKLVLLLAFGLVLAAITLAACSVRDPEGLGQSCDTVLPCPSPFVCVERTCVSRCNFSGDCDPGFACIDEVCLSTCETEEDCPEGLPCRPTDLEGTNFCGFSTDKVCGTTDDCPNGFACEGSRCVETCESDDECPPAEACRNRGNFGQCRFGPRPGDFESEPDAGTDVALPNNIPTNRNCANKASGYCQMAFGSDEICLEGRCRVAPNTLVIIDKTEGEECDLDNTPEDPPGIDLTAVADSSRSVLWAEVSDIVVTEGGQAAPAEDLPLDEPQFACFAAPVSTGCGGWVALTTRDPLVSGRRITVSEIGDTCGSPATERYEVRICTDNRQVTLARDLVSCTLFMGEGTGERTITVSY